MEVQATLFCRHPVHMRFQLFRGACPGNYRLRNKQSAGNAAKWQACSCESFTIRAYQ